MSEPKVLWEGTALGEAWQLVWSLDGPQLRRKRDGEWVVAKALIPASTVAWMLFRALGEPDAGGTD